jgi:aminoglycoside phosphotransferase (APT) family kinase protein
MSMTGPATPTTPAAEPAHDTSHMADAHIDPAKLTAWLDEKGIGEGPITITPIAGGTQNVMARIKRGDREIVIRHPPPHKRGNSDETMRREARLLRALSNAAVPHPRLIADEPSTDALGSAFYVMECVDGFAPTLGLPPAYADPTWKHEMGLSMADGIAALASVDHVAVGLSDFGRADGWLERQVERWRSHLASYDGTPGYDGHGIDSVVKVGDWLDAHQPATWKPGIIHGDFHFGNVMYCHDEPHLAAIVDWELATIGDPLLDLGQLLITFPSGESGVSVIDAAGLPTRDELIARYTERTVGTGRAIDAARVTWYQVLAAYRLGIILEGSNARAAAGLATKEIGDRLHATTLTLFAQAETLIDS